MSTGTDMEPMATALQDELLEDALLAADLTWDALAAYGAAGASGTAGGGAAPILGPYGGVAAEDAALARTGELDALAAGGAEGASGVAGDGAAGGGGGSDGGPASVLSDDAFLEDMAHDEHGGTAASRAPVSSAGMAGFSGVRGGFPVVPAAAAAPVLGRDAELAAEDAALARTGELDALAARGAEGASGAAGGGGAATAAGGGGGGGPASVSSDDAFREDMAHDEHGGTAASRAPVASASMSGFSGVRGGFPVTSAAAAPVLGRDGELGTQLAPKVTDIFPHIVKDKSDDTDVMECEDVEARRLVEMAHKVSTSAPCTELRVGEDDAALRRHVAAVRDVSSTALEGKHGEALRSCSGAGASATVPSAVEDCETLRRVVSEAAHPDCVVVEALRQAVHGAVHGADASVADEDVAAEQLCLDTGPVRTCDAATPQPTVLARGDGAHIAANIARMDQVPAAPSSLAAVGESDGSVQFGAEAAIASAKLRIGDDATANSGAAAVRTEDDNGATLHCRVATTGLGAPAACGAPPPAAGAAPLVGAGASPAAAAAAVGAATLVDVGRAGFVGFLGTVGPPAVAAAPLSPALALQRCTSPAAAIAAAAVAGAALLSSGRAGLLGFGGPAGATLRAEGDRVNLLHVPVAAADTKGVGVDMLGDRADTAHTGDDIETLRLRVAEAHARAAANIEGNVVNVLWRF